MTGPMRSKSSCRIYGSVRQRGPEYGVFLHISEYGVLRSTPFELGIAL